MGPVNIMKHRLTSLPILAIPIILIIFGSSSFHKNAKADDWTSWRGPNGDGISLETDWDPGALSGDPRILWKVNVGFGFSSVSVKGKKLYTMGNIKDQDIVFCLDTESGKVIWTHSYQCTPGDYRGPRATPVVDEGYVYTLSREGHLHCLSAKNGKVRWKRHLADDFGVEIPSSGFSGSPVIDGDLLVLNAGKHGTVLNKKKRKDSVDKQTRRLRIRSTRYLQLQRDTIRRGIRAKGSLRRGAKNRKTGMDLPMGHEVR